MNNIQTLIPVFIFLAVMIIIGFYSSKKQKTSGGVQKEYFLGSQNLGGLVLAMTFVATYGSVSSFVSGPGVAWNLGYGWVVFAAPQIITGFLLLGFVGKKMAMLSFKTGAFTVTDLLYRRFDSKLLTVILSIVLLVFFTAMIVGQFIGGAQIFSAITGLDYKLGLLLFASVTVLYTSGGFKAVVITDAICAILMLIGMFTLAYTILDAGGGIDNINATLAATNVKDGVSTNFSVNAGGALPFTLLFSAWLLVGFCTIGLPQSLVRCMSYKKTQELHKAMIVATIICGALMIGVTLLGVLSRGVILDMPEKGTDSIIPTLIVTRMDPILAGITIIGPLAATMSTVSSLLIAASSAVMRDLNYQLFPDRYEAIAQKKHLSISFTLFLGVVSIVLATFPLDIIVWINMFAFGGLETTFLWPIALGLFFPFINKTGVLSGIIIGLSVYTLCTVFKINLMGAHAIVVGTAVSFIATVTGSFFGQKIDNKTMEIFFPHKVKA